MFRKPSRNKFFVGMILFTVFFAVGMTLTNAQPPGIDNVSPITGHNVNNFAKPGGAIKDTGSKPGGNTVVKSGILPTGAGVNDNFSPGPNDKNKNQYNGPGNQNKSPENHNQGPGNHMKPGDKFPNWKPGGQPTGNKPGYQPGWKPNFGNQQFFVSGSWFSLGGWGSYYMPYQSLQFSYTALPWFMNAFGDIAMTDVFVDQNAGTATFMFVYPQNGPHNINGCEILVNGAAYFIPTNAYITAGHIGLIDVPLSYFAPGNEVVVVANDGTIIQDFIWTGYSLEFRTDGVYSTTATAVTYYGYNGFYLA